MTDQIGNKDKTMNRREFTKAGAVALSHGVSCQRQPQGWRRSSLRASWKPST